MVTPSPAKPFPDKQLEMVQTAFGWNFGSMAQGDNETGQKGMNAMFGMLDEINHVLRQGKKLCMAILLLTTAPQKMSQIVPR
jgi:hypothetical protein